MNWGLVSSKKELTFIDKQEKDEKGKAIIVSSEQAINVASFIHIAKAIFLKKNTWKGLTSLLYPLYKAILDV